MTNIIKRVVLFMVFVAILSSCQSREPVNIEGSTEEATASSHTQGSGSEDTSNAKGTSKTIAEIEQETTSAPAPSIEERRQTWLTRKLDAMPIEAVVGQLFYVDLQTYNRGKIPAGGIIFFKEDLTTWEATQVMLEDLQANAQVPLFLGIDEEGGIVSRISGKDSIGGTSVPSPWQQTHSDETLSVAEASAVIILELSDLGFNMNFAPVADVNSNPSNPIIGRRSYSDSPVLTSKYIREVLAVYESSQIIPVVKHFPGHGDTEGDSHLNPVYVNKDMTGLSEMELIPFQGAIDSAAPVMMVGHITLPLAVEDQRPATLNPEIIRELLLEDMGFQGVVISDSLVMESIRSHYTYEEVINYGLEAGLDMFLMPDQPEAAYGYLLDKVKNDSKVEERVRESVMKILALKFRQTE